MDDINKSKEELIQELALLREQVVKLKMTKLAFDAQRKLFKTFATTMQTASGTLMIRVLLQQIVEITRKLTKAESCSMFLLDTNGIVSESILARGATMRGQKQRLIGEVLDKGLAGWVYRHRQIGLINDTMKDDRWFTLPNQPYTARSALSIPILKSKNVLAIITLTHVKKGYFKPELVHLIETIAEPISLILDHAQLSNEYHLHLTKTGLSSPELSPKITEKLSNEGELSLFGMYILFGEGNFLYVSPMLADIFGYTFGELISLESVIELVAADNRKIVSEQINLCITGQNKSLSSRFIGQRKDSSLINVEVYGIRTKLYGKFVIIGSLRLV
ncbi:MAG TPA: diguanylate cyclase [Cyanobacteria bacterium UBA11149]|nr:diguanylate cyclase [Cyanobacteria bacterium UBA11367]HBE60319.1 diguanylate cyclase [Cyanobacteria bacterium UBA11366]HBK65265.1 diguanylate cyclase [Cyanobacteria bacterium UBA11166]HBR73078.1 diguanylate cyclase [Cyanobacteria bacterium UBA11159]HBS71004.1 diguanylate cyclase [Cyanobacteria bacterium UBA11153]HBW89467.1 diguanylate cyclase [Cyanobacteria bacterium UBA11149]HCA97921.1 diguanylate cyclase [Cyanobacteria bacterium UBA9226]